jgi:hypothetical protein
MKGKLIFPCCTLIALSVTAHVPPVTHAAVSVIGIDSSAWAKSGPDVFWLDKYGNIPWEDEKARLDNFAIQLMNDPNLVGYYYVIVGKESCRGEGQARAIRAKNYMTKVRHVDCGKSHLFRVLFYLRQRYPFRVLF